MLLKNVNLRIAISSKCNMHCVYCEGSKGYKPGKPGAMEDFRRTPIENGNIDTDTLLDIIRLFRVEKFEGLTLTGGEPLLNKNLDKIIKEAAIIGFKRIEMTTNATLLKKYLKEKGNLPHELTLLKISLDTTDPKRFKLITQGGNLNNIISALNKINHRIKTRANKVLLKSDLPNLLEYLDTCQKIGFKEINLLDLVLYSNRHNKKEKEFFEKEYVSFTEIRNYFIKNLNVDFTDFHKYGHALVLPSGLKIIMKDSNVAVRNENCLSCPVYCQEGIYTVRIATDGNITYCPDFNAELPSINGPSELKNGSLSKKIKKLASIITNAKKIDSFENYSGKHHITFR